jgi:hypothetical protein
MSRDYFDILKMAQVLVNRESPASTEETRKYLAREVAKYAVEHDESVERAWLAI